MKDGSIFHGRKKGDSRPREECLQSLGSAGTEWLREVGESLLSRWAEGPNGLLRMGEAELPEIRAANNGGLCGAAGLQRK